MLATISRFARLRSEQGVDIRVDYNTTFDETKTNMYVSDIRFTVSADTGVISTPSEVTVVLVNAYYLNYNIKKSEQVYQISLTHSSTDDGQDHYTGSLTNRLASRLPDPRGFLVALPQVVVRINNRWQVDPIHHQPPNNFNFIWQSS